MLRVDSVFVHFEDTELLDNFNNSQLHIHGDLADVINNFEQALDSFDGLDIGLEFLLVGCSIVDHLVQVFDSNFGEHFTKSVQPVLNLIVSTLDDLRVIDQNQIVLL